MARLSVAYILWFFGGIFGLHHFYLKRDRHAFVWWATLGGLFGLGWIRDIWKLSEYVQEANKDDEWVSDYMRRVAFSRPPRSTARFAGQIIMGNILAYLVRMLIPEHLVESTTFSLGYLLAITLPQIGGAIGVHLVSNIGRHKTTMGWPMIGAFLPTPWLIINPGNITLSPLAAAIFTQWKGVQWRSLGPDTRRGFCKRISTLTFFGILYLSLWGCVIYFNASVTTKDGEEIPLREAIPNFFKSPAWAETKDSFNRLYNYYKVHGWHKIYEEIVEAIDPVGEQNAYKVLGVSSSASQEEITHAYRQLARQWHPDKHKDPEKKLEAQEKFIEIQKAYDTLSSIKSKRSRKNKKSTRPEKDEF